MRNLPEGLHGAFVVEEALRLGWSRTALRTAVAGGRLVRPFRGVFLPPAPDPLARAAAVVLATGGVASHLTAARAFGLPELDDGDWATVGTRVHRAPRQSVHLHREDLPPHELGRVRGVPMTSPEKTVLDLCRRAGRLQAVCALEQAIRRELVQPALLDRLAGDPQRRVRRRAALADPRSESPLETAVRLLLADAGIATTPQVVVPDERGRPLARLDLLVDGSRVAIECDGTAVHSQPEALYRDRERANELAAKFTIVRFTWADLRREGQIVRTVRAAMARAR